MKVLLIAGIIYLVGVMLILWLQPEAMFREDGTWKEFGIGRDRENYTWCPFWLFILIWSVLSYSVSHFMFAFKNAPVTLIDKSDTQSIISTAKSTTKKRTIKGKRKVRTSLAQKTLTPGYYALNKDATKKLGTPKYVYIGKDAPK